MRCVPVVATTRQDERTEDSVEPTHPPPPTLALWFAAIGLSDENQRPTFCQSTSCFVVPVWTYANSIGFYYQQVPYLWIVRCASGGAWERHCDAVTAKIKERERRRETDRNPQQKLKIKNLYKKKQIPAVNSCMKKYHLWRFGLLFMRKNWWWIRCGIHVWFLS